MKRPVVKGLGFTLFYCLSVVSLAMSLLFVKQIQRVSSVGQEAVNNSN